jgi:hypothetical protein
MLATEIIYLHNPTVGKAVKTLAWVLPYGANLEL